MNMFIDDERHPPDGKWDVVRDSETAKDFVLIYGCPKFISFDHDLGGEDTSMHFINWLIERDLDFGVIPDDFDFYVHSANPVGAQNIEGKLRKYLEFRQNNK